MRFGLLGADEDAMKLVASATDPSAHRFTVAYESDAFSEDLMRLGVVVRNDEWENLLHSPECDAIVVGRGGDGDYRADQLRKLVQAAIPLVVVHPTGDMLLCFELQMIQLDTGSPIVPYFPGLEHPVIKSWGPFGEVAERGEPSQLSATGSGQFMRDELPSRRLEIELKQVLFERGVVDSSPEGVSDQFARDALLLRRWVGRIDRVGVLGSQPYPSDDWGNLSVHMTSREGVIARWSASPESDSAPSDESSIQVTAVTSEGKSRLQLARSVDDWSHQDDEAAAASDVWPLDLLSTMVSEPDNREFGDGMWEDACRAVELTDTLHPSYRRGKTIELYHEKHTEEETFKGMMAAGGCLAILFCTFLLPFLVAVDSLNIPFFQGEHWGRWPWKALHYSAWPFYLFAALALFLSLQFLRLAFLGDGEKRKTDQS